MFLTQEHFQGKHKYRRWISGLHSVQDDRGKVVMKVGECSHPIDPPASSTLLYSWRLLGPARERRSSVPKGLRGPPRAARIAAQWDGLCEESDFQ